MTLLDSLTEADQAAVLTQIASALQATTAHLAAPKPDPNVKPPPEDIQWSDVY